MLTKEILDGTFNGCISTTMKYERGFCTNQPARVCAECKFFAANCPVSLDEFARVSIGPAIFHRDCISTLVVSMPRLIVGKVMQIASKSEGITVLAWCFGSVLDRLFVTLFKRQIEIISVRWREILVDDSPNRLDHRSRRF